MVHRDFVICCLVLVLIELVAAIHVSAAHITPAVPDLSSLKRDIPCGTKLSSRQEKAAPGSAQVMHHRG